MTMMQRDETLRFWDDYYMAEQGTREDSTRKEWILQPSLALLAAVCEHLPSTTGSDYDDVCEILEIGCGTSNLSRNMYKYLDQNTTTDKKSKRHYRITATDVSQICIEQNLARDDQNVTVRSNGKRVATTCLQYQVLNALEPSDDLLAKYDMILDKGCLDTFLFRSRKRGPSSTVHSPLVRSLLDNVHSWLKEGGKYVILTPREKIKSLRDYTGFSSITRISLDHHSSGLVLGDLDGNCQQRTQVHMHICTNSNRQSDRQAGFRQTYDTSLHPENSCCSSCGISFVSFRKGENMQGRGEGYWSRRWKGHRVHCKKGTTTC